MVDQHRRLSNNEFWENGSLSSSSSPWAKDHSSMLEYRQCVKPLKCDIGKYILVKI